MEVRRTYSHNCFSITGTFTGRTRRLIEMKILLIEGLMVISEQETSTQMSQKSDLSGVTFLGVQAELLFQSPRI